MKKEVYHKFIKVVYDLYFALWFGKKYCTAAKKWLSANDSKWELAIVDLCLTQGSGLNVLKDCQSRSARQKVVVFTSDTEEHLLRRCRELGADAVFDKAHDVEKLVNFCKRHAANLESMESME